MPTGSAAPIADTSVRVDPLVSSGRLSDEEAIDRERVAQALVEVSMQWARPWV